MKTQLFLPAAFAALLLASCNREAPLSESKPVEIHVNIQGTVATRSTEAAYDKESKVNNLQVYVFNDGNLEDYQNAGSQTSATLTATAGARTVWALVNAPVLSSIRTEAELQSHVSQLGDNTPENLVMTGYTRETLTDGGTVSVTVERIVARVSLQKISTAFQYSLEDKSLTVNGIYLINVAGDSDYAVSGAPTSWLNRLGHQDSACDALLYDALNGVVVNNATSYEKEHVFYPYPNPTVDKSHEATWNPRHTMLVVEVTFEGKKGYYPVELPVLERNKTYTIQEIRIKHRPGEEPYKPIETGDATVTITVHDWVTGTVIDTLVL